MARLAAFAFITCLLAIDTLSPIGEVPIWQMARDQASNALATNTDAQLANQDFETKCKRKTILPAYNRVQDQICGAKVKIDLPRQPDFSNGFGNFD